MTTTETNCPVAALADEAYKLIAAKDAADEASIDSATSEEKLEAQRTLDAADRFLRGVIERATFLQPESAKGVLFQLCVVSDLVDDLEGCVTEKGFIEGRLATMSTPQDKEAAKLAKKIGRVLDSIAGYIEATTGARREDACGDYYIARHLSDHAALSGAFGSNLMKDPAIVEALDAI
jgi:hypothetical protein